MFKKEDKVTSLSDTTNAWVKAKLVEKSEWKQRTAVSTIYKTIRICRKSVLT